jgi:hypothetical protein
VRPRPSELVNRNAEMMARYNADPMIPYSVLADSFGISTERVRFLITQRMRKLDPAWRKTSRFGHGLTSDRACKKCGVLFHRKRSRDVYCDEHRGKGYVNGESLKGNVTRRCLVCTRTFQYSVAKLHRATYRVGVYCSDACRKHSLKTRPLRTRGKK